MTVTVCIPAYRAGAFIVETVGSVLRQSHDDLRVVVAVDPPSDGSRDDTADALEAFRSDRRLSWHVNSRRLGWAQNVNSLVDHVKTPYYAFLPHDDIWCPNYLEVLLEAINARPEAVVAYADSLRFGDSDPVRVGVDLRSGEDRLRGLLRFLIQGTEAHMWRGVSRTEALHEIGGFPIDGHKGLVVECEYSLALFGAGTVVHVPRTLYFKRIYERIIVSASRERMTQPLPERVEGWEEHDRRMTRLLEKALADTKATSEQATLCHAAKDAALVRRRQQFVGKTLEARHLERIAAALSACADSSDPLAPEVAANLHLVLQVHFESVGDSTSANEESRKAWTVAPNSAAAVLAHAKALDRDNRPLEALERASEVIRLSPRDEAMVAHALIRQIYDKLQWTAPFHADVANPSTEDGTAVTRPHPRHLDPSVEVTRGVRPYLEVLSDLHAVLAPKKYLEIGVRHGASLALATCPAIAVDPVPETGTLPSNVKLHRCTSDDFFLIHASSAMRGEVDLAFIDGVHLAEFVYRDFINVERIMAQNGMIVIDDVYPNHPIQARRVRTSQVWTGDVWRFALFLESNRPDLELTWLDTAPGGLLMVSNLSPVDDRLREMYDATVREWAAQPDVAPPRSILSREHAIAPTRDVLLRHSKR